MNTATLLQFLFSGLMVGAIYGLVALGLNIVFTILSRSNFRLQPPAARFAPFGG